MKKAFTFILPDEPYKDTTALNQVINAEYTGPRYLVARLENSTGIVQNAANGSDALEGLEFERFHEEGHTFFVIDANENPFEAAYLTNAYTHDEIVDPTFELPRGLGSWTYHYDDFKGGLSQCFYQIDLKYNTVSKEFTAPRYRLHANSRENSFAAFKTQADVIKKSLVDHADEYSAEDKTKLQEYADWLDNLETTFHDVDHWKIPFSLDTPPVI
jgi:hypothetical protein